MKVLTDILLRILLIIRLIINHRLCRQNTYGSLGKTNENLISQI